MEQEQAGRAVTVSSYYGQNIIGMVEAMEIDLVGGFVAKLDVVGRVEVST